MGQTGKPLLVPVLCLALGFVGGWLLRPGRRAGEAVEVHVRPVAEQSGARSQPPRAAATEGLRAYDVPALPTAPAPAPAPAPTRVAAFAPAQLPTPDDRPFCVVQDFVVREPNSIGAIWFDGDIVNLGPKPAAVKIVAKAYSINEVLLDSKAFYPDRYTIPPGEKAHFNNYVRSPSGETIRKVIPEVVPTR